MLRLVVEGKTVDVPLEVELKGEKAIAAYVKKEHKLALPDGEGERQKRIKEAAEAADAAAAKKE